MWNELTPTLILIYEHRNKAVREKILYISRRHFLKSKMKNLVHLNVFELKMRNAQLMQHGRLRASQNFRSYLPHSGLQSEWSGVLLVAVLER